MAEQREVKQTGFRADKDLVNRFQSKLALEGRDMTTVFVDFMTVYVSGDEPAPAVMAAVVNGALSDPETSVLRDTIRILRGAGEASNALLRQTVRTLIHLEDWGNEGHSNKTYPANRAGGLVTVKRLEEAFRMAEGIERSAAESRRTGRNGSNNAPRPRNGRTKLAG